MRLLFIALAASAPLWVGTANAAELSPASIQADIARDGARAVVARLSGKSGGPWKEVILHISSGQDAWLSVVGALRPGVDAGTAEDLTGALASALRKNPEPVLKLIGPNFPLDQVCDIPLIEPTNAQLAAWKRSVLDALSHVKDAVLSDRATACSKAISAIK
jgi:hypothetical protein